MKIRTAIVEDEPVTRKWLRVLLEKDAEMDVVAECADGRSAINVIAERKPDLIFLDIQLPDRNGFDVLSGLGQRHLPAVVFVTAHDRFALQAFEVHALDYLLKPFNAERFEQALRHAKAQFGRYGKAEHNGNGSDLNGRHNGPDAADRISIKSSGKLIFIRTDEIDSVEAADNYVKVKAGGLVHTVRDTLGAFESRLPADHFVRISRSWIINMNRLKELYPKGCGEYDVALIDGTHLRLTRGYRRNLKRLRESAR